MGLLLKYWKAELKVSLQYRVSFILTFISQFIIFFTFYFTIYALFQRFGSLKEFNFYEILLCFSVIQIGFSVSEVFARGFDRFERLVINGDFDRLLVRPQNIYLQILGSMIAYERTGRLLQGILIFFIALFNLDIDFSLLKVLTLIFMIVGAASIFTGLFIMGAAFCFVTIQGLELRNIFTDGGREMAQYPMGIYKKPFFYFFTFIIPFSCVNYFPLLYVLGKINNSLYSLLPLCATLFLIPSILIFNKGIKSYRGTGS
jgi:ABC-2 type transport system permease protein